MTQFPKQRHEHKAPPEMFARLIHACLARFDDPSYPLVQAATEIAEEYGLTQAELFELLPSLETLLKKEAEVAKQIADRQT